MATLSKGLKEDQMTVTKMFKTMVVEEEQNNQFSRKITEKSIEDLPPGDVLVNVHYSSLNYKDALSAIGNKGVTRNYPHTPGIDAAGLWKKAAIHVSDPEMK
jgi:acrylyl-CoA reductase (NADPH)